MKSTKNKRRNKRFARKRSLKWISDITRDSIYSARRGWGTGISK